MADTSIRIELSLADAAAQKSLSDFVAKAGFADTSFKKLGETGASTFGLISAHIGESTGLFEIFAGNLAANVAIEALNLLAEGAHKLFEVFIVEGVKAAEENQNAINSLNVALAASSHYTKEASESFVEFAEQLQKNSTFSHEAIVSNAALIESLGRLDTDGLKRATTAAADLAAQFNKDLPTAAAAVGKAAEGNVTALKKLGITFAEGRDNAETFANALTAIEEHAGGAAQSKVNTYSGAVAQAGHAFEDLTEQIGNVIVKNPAIIDAIHETTAIFEKLSAALAEQNTSFAAIVGQGLSLFLGAMAFVVQEIDLSVRIFQTLIGVLDALAIPVLAVLVPIRALVVGVKQATAEFESFTALAGKNLTALGESGRGSLYQVSKGLLDIQAAADKGLASLKAGADGTVEPTNKSSKAVKELSDEMKGAEDRAKSFALGLVKAGEDGKQASSDSLALAKAQMEAEIALDQNLVVQKIISRETFEMRKYALESEYRKKTEDAEVEAFEKQSALIDFALAHQKISYDDAIKARVQLSNQFIASEAKNDQKRISDDAKANEALKNAENKTYAERMSALNSLAALQNSKHHEMVAIGKAANLVQIGMDTATGAIAAYKAMATIPYVGPFLGAAAAAAITAYGVEREADVLGLNFADGGIVGGTSFIGDRIQANVNSGEMILNKEQQMNLFEIARNGNSGGGQAIDYDRLGTSVARALSSQPISVNFDGREVMGVIRGQLQSGRTFA